MSEGNETSDMWREFHEHKRQKKLQNKKVSIEMLMNAGAHVSWMSPDQVHLKVDSPNGTINFWPSTGLYILPSGKRSRGVLKLLKELKL